MKKNLPGFFLFAFISYLLFQSSQGFQKIAWGTGVWWKQYSLMWGVAYVSYTLFCVFIAVFVGLVIWRTEKIQPLFYGAIRFRERLGVFRWLLSFLVLISPVLVFQYTPWGVVFKDIYIRLLTWGLVVFLFAFLIKKGNGLAGWDEYIVAALLTSSEFIAAVQFMDVTNYPFSLGWSEGNRMWDYSILFGRRLYDYPADQGIYVLLDIGRQFVNGLPFMIPGLTIGMERAWIALMALIPYLLLGIVSFRFSRSDLRVWLFGALWVLIFLTQGPIHPPLVLCAVGTVFLWRKPLWFALPLIALTGYLAVQSRFTWLFAPGLWIGMLELAGAALQNKKLNANSWIRAILLGLVGMLGGMYGRAIVGLFIGQAAGAAVSVDGAISMVSDPSQPLLWYRLLPNATYGVGVLMGLIIAVLPLIAVLLYLISSKKWTPNLWQSLAMWAPLLAFLGVGLIVSTKIGGGGDLHNLDMFLIGLMFTAVIAWENGGKEWLKNDNVQLAPAWVKLALVLMFILPGFQSLKQMRSFHLGEDVSWLRAFTEEAKLGSPPAQAEAALGMLPTQAEADDALQVIQAEVDNAKLQGDVLFIDQRQLLTFGHITNVPLVPDYEKKLLMNQALSANAAYFESFYEDLASHRFSLIVSEPLRMPVQDSSDQFGEENNAWVTWVSTPVLCYYEPLITLKDVKVQLLIPKADMDDCSFVMPK